ncbi:polysaccharide biosynthesis protein [Egicoccus sp. AB-alg2]|uniref:polysaccharide biosynthesis protein n=1 Tax=Egicoccus sp. AB-alg2 TaxID=3242693 RepID=UPI00359D0F61
MLVIGIVAFAWVVAFLIRFDGLVPAPRVGQLAASLPLVVLVQLGALQLAGANRHSWRYTTIDDLLPLVSAVGATALALAWIRATAPGLIAEWPTLDWLLIPFGAIGVYGLLATTLLAGARVLRRVLAERAEADAVSQDEAPRRVLLVGAGRAGVAVARDLQSRPDVGRIAVGFVDDDPLKRGRRIVGLDVLGGSEDLPDLVERYRIDDVVISIASASGPVMRELIERCERAGRRPLIVPGLYEIVGGKVSLNRFRPVAVEDLLGRDPIELDLSALDDLLHGEVVLVTGAGGSIGSELARQVASFAPKRIVLVERSEPALWAIHRELVAEHSLLDVVPAMADVGDEPRMRSLIQEHRPALILHAAAHKHVPMMEENPGEAIKNNVLATKVLVDAAADLGVRHLVQISTDKAVNPTSVMGATKRLAERYVQHVAHRTGLPYVSVRFGNVLGSVGSVVPIFEEQIANGGPVTVTHPDMRRYFMTIPEASQLVLQAATLGHGGEVLVLDMGEPIKIADLAESMIRLSGFEPGVDIQIEFTGLRPGEKLFEELSLTEERAERTRHPKILTGITRTPTWLGVEAALRDLAAAAVANDVGKTRNLLQSFIPEFAQGSAPLANGSRSRPGS